MTRVLVVDDDPQLLRALRINLSVRPGRARWPWPPNTRPRW
jgi:DNA-binding response OmpR family regulator